MIETCQQISPWQTFWLHQTEPNTDSYFCQKFVIRFLFSSSGRTRFLSVFCCSSIVYRISEVNTNEVTSLRQTTGQYQHRIPCRRILSQSPCHHDRVRPDQPWQSVYAVDDPHWLRKPVNHAEITTLILDNTNMKTEHEAKRLNSVTNLPIFVYLSL
jgi:hypothetical protein